MTSEQLAGVMKIINDNEFSRNELTISRFERGPMAIILFPNHWEYIGPSQRDNEGEPMTGSYSLNGISELESLVKFGVRELRESQYENLVAIRHDWEWINNLANG